LVGLAGLHIAAALKHQLVDKDGLIGRMLPGRH
jgi:cytochrome b561